jgi:hypothetical protein
MKADTAMKKFLKAWLIYESVKELRKEAEEANSAEQQAYIEPLFAKAFPELSANGIKYKDSWKCDEEQESIKAWEIAEGIDVFCSDVAARVSPFINKLIQKERVAEDNALNAALDMMENDEKSGTLTIEEKQRFREAINTKGYNRERNKLIDYLQKYVDSVK